MAWSASDAELIRLTSEEVMAVQNLQLKDDCISESNATFRDSKSNFSKNKKKNSWSGPPQPKNRDALGNYVPPPGKKPLSHLGVPTPGPEYLPSLQAVQKQYPQYTIGPQFPANLDTAGNPAPNKYDTSRNMNWGRCKRITIKQRNPPSKMKPSPGPATYKTKPLASGPKFTMLGRLDNRPGGIICSPLVMPINPEAPAPDYAPQSAWLERPVTMGTSRRSTDKTAGPGPGRYDAPVNDKGPSFTMTSLRRDKTAKVPGPGPGKYKLRTTIGKGPSAPMCFRHPPTHDPKDWVPGPDLYHRAGFRLDEPGVTMKYRWMDSDPVITPGPSDYNANKPRQRRGGPTISGRFQQKTGQATPGPTDYKPVHPANGPQGISIGHKIHEHTRNSTVSKYYSDQEKANLLMPKAPAYSFNGRTNPLKAATRVPPPNKYTPRFPTCRKKFTMGKRLDRSPKSIGPGPAREDVRSPDDEPLCQPCQSAQGSSLKGRHTPLKYSGFHNVSLIGSQQPKGVEFPPIIG